MIQCHPLVLPKCSFIWSSPCGISIHRQQITSLCNFADYIPWSSCSIIMLIRAPLSPLGHPLHCTVRHTLQWTRTLLDVWIKLDKALLSKDNISHSVLHVWTALARQWRNRNPCITEMLCMAGKSAINQCEMGVLKSLIRGSDRIKLWITFLESSTGMWFS